MRAGGGWRKNKRGEEGVFPSGDSPRLPHAPIRSISSPSADQSKQDIHGTLEKPQQSSKVPDDIGEYAHPTRVGKSEVHRK
jgi:hypothetical protein